MLACPCARRPGRRLLARAPCIRPHRPAVGRNNDVIGARAYPASYKIDNVVSVAASTFNDVLSSFSNYGPNSVSEGGAAGPSRRRRPPLCSAPRGARAQRRRPPQRATVPPAHGPACLPMCAAGAPGCSWREHCEHRLLGGCGIQNGLRRALLLCLLPASRAPARRRSPLLLLRRRLCGTPRLLSGLWPSRPDCTRPHVHPSIALLALQARAWPVRSSPEQPPCCLPPSPESATWTSGVCLAACLLVQSGCAAARGSAWD